MSDFVRICSQGELPGSGNVKEFTVAGRAICVANVDGDICVLDGTCPHEGGPLGEGSVEGGKLACPWHGYTFDPRTGATEEDQDLHAQVLEAKLEQGELKARL